LADRPFGQTLAGGEQRVSGQDRERLVADGAEWRSIRDRLVDIEQQHASHPGSVLLALGLGLVESQQSKISRI